QPVGGDGGADQHGEENQFLDAGEDGLSQFALGLGEQDGARRVEQGGQQQVLDAGGVDQPDGVEGRDQGDQQVLVAFAGGLLVGLAAPGQQHRVGAGPEVGHQNHRGGQVQQAEVGGGVEQGDDQEQLDQPVGQPQGVGRDLVGVLLAQELRHGVVAGAGEEDLGAQQGPGQQRPGQRDDQADGDQLGAPGADHLLQHAGHRR